MPIARVREIAQTLANELDYELVDIERVKDAAGQILRIYVDKGDGIKLSEVEAYHRRIHPLVEDADFDYLEVSSPGADRPLKTARDFEKAMGALVEAHTYRPIDGAKEYIGELLDYSDETVGISFAGARKEFLRKDISVIRPYIDFDEDDFEDIDEIIDETAGEDAGNNQEEK
jgi:ribosome maturation factor RimP